MPLQQTHNCTGGLTNSQLLIFDRRIWRILIPSVRSSKILMAYDKITIAPAQM
jgi:hypothetical protein